PVSRKKANVCASLTTTLVTVTLQPNWSQIYSGEKITVRCEIQGGDTGWTYEWKTNSSFKPSNQHEYRISSASSSHSGDYRCRGRMKSAQHNITKWSVSIKLTVYDSNLVVQDSFTVHDICKKDWKRRLRARAVLFYKSDLQLHELFEAVIKLYLNLQKLMLHLRESSCLSFIWSHVSGHLMNPSPIFIDFPLCFWSPPTPEGNNLAEQVVLR
uniref:Ig-like domain-containing protein n=1 Tax=Seriola lalandi dorsalis TaxID=1841481 RepID=A0A3B4WWX9_SERLL